MPDVGDGTGLSGSVLAHYPLWAGTVTDASGTSEIPAAAHAK
jgi:hypothetical protein